MSVREKLVELLKNAKSAMKSENLSCDIARNMFVVDFMISNGVTVQEWIPVTERLPEEDGSYLVTIDRSGGRQVVNILWFAKDGETVDEYELAEQKYVWYFYDSEYGYISTDSVTHWMPMPEPPKGE